MKDVTNSRSVPKINSTFLLLQNFNKRVEILLFKKINSPGKGNVGLTVNLGEFSSIIL